MSSDNSAATGAYDPDNYTLLSFHDAVPKFLEGSDTPRAYLERCLETVTAREDEVQAFAVLNGDGARAAADAATERYKDGRPLSAVDGMPFGIKDLIETVDMPTEYNSDLFRGNQPIRDAACVYYLRKGGAVPVGKTVTVTFGGGDPSHTRNPHDVRRTPGGSSSGSAASVGAAMLPVALGTHARGSTIRPASFCGIYGLKATFGALNRQGVFSAAHSMDHLGVLTGSLEDMWITARHISEFAGGDPGHPGLYGGAHPPAPVKPAKLIRLDTAGWAETDAATKAAFEAYLGTLTDAGIEIFGREDDAAIAAYEHELADMPSLWTNLYRWEMRWPLFQYRDYDESKIPPRLKKGLEVGDGLTQAEYRAALVKRDYVKGLHDDLARRVDGFITLASPGPGPIGMDQGSAIYNEGSSVMGCPAVSLPFLAVDDAPVGVQLQGREHGDEAMTARARWLVAHRFGQSQ